MRAASLIPTVLLAALLPVLAGGCGDDGNPRAAVAPTTAASDSPTTARTTTPPPATEMSAISRDSQAELTAEGARAVVVACHAKTHDYRRCATTSGSALGTFKAATWGTEPGQVNIRGTAGGYTLDSRSFSGAHFVITQTVAGKVRRTCRESVSECDHGRW